MLGAGQRPDLNQLVDMLYLTLGIFWLAVTIERYEEMAVAVATVGITHRYITGRSDIMASCYGHAAEYALWAGNKSSSGYYKEISEELSK